MDIDDATNGLLLPTPSVHFSKHNEHNRAISRALDLIPDDLDIDQTMDQVYLIQSRAVQAFADGNKLTRGNRLTDQQWFNILTGATNP